MHSMNWRFSDFRSCFSTAIWWQKIYLLSSALCGCWWLFRTHSWQSTGTHPHAVPPSGPRCGWCQLQAAAGCRYRWSQVAGYLSSTGNYNEHCWFTSLLHQRRINIPNSYNIILAFGLFYTTLNISSRTVDLPFTATTIYLSEKFCITGWQHLTEMLQPI